MAKYLLIEDEVRPIDVKHNQVYFTDTNELVPEKYLKGYKSQLMKPTDLGYNYNSKLFAALTNSPYQFWYDQDNEFKAKAMEILYKITPELQNLRETKLRDVYAKRSKRANNARWKAKSTD